VAGEGRALNVAFREAQAAPAKIFDAATDSCFGEGRAHPTFAMITPMTHGCIE
jgi:hypothetical protein